MELTVPIYGSETVARYNAAMKSSSGITAVILASLVAAGFYADEIMPAASTASPSAAANTADKVGGNCLIKGNISVDKSERIYHLPGQQYYETTSIRPEFGERWFCSEADAVAAGWRRSRR